MTTAVLLERPARLALVPEAGVVVQIYASDPITQLGLLAQLGAQDGLRPVIQDDPGATVALAVADVADEATVRWLRAIHGERRRPVVLVVGTLDPRALSTVVDAGVCSIVNRREATPERLAAVVQAAASGRSELPPQLLRQLLDQVGRLGRDVLAPRGLSFTGLTKRERDVLKLVADGHSTREVANELCYSERTIKNVLQELTTRLHLRNRTQAVAYAVRNGWI